MKDRLPTTDAVEILHQRYYENRPERGEDLEAERINTEIARTLYDLRKAAGLTQKQLARRVGTTPSVISRLENEGYEGHSLTTLRKIAEALGKKLSIQILSVTKEEKKPEAV